MLLRICPLLLLMTPGCLSPEGINKPTWSRGELLTWHAAHERPGQPRMIFGYAGSDTRFHHFIARPIDSFVDIKVPRSEITMPDERDTRDLGKRLYFHRVDPSDGFNAIAD